MLLTQKLFKDLGHEKAIAFLKEEPRMIQVKEYDHFVVLNYNQIFSQEDDPYVMECRSLQLDYQGEVISRAYPRFFNYGQRPEITGKFVFEGCEVYEKADGSLIRIYWNKFANGGFGRWEIATRGTAFAESESSFYKSFRLAVIEDGFHFKDEDEFQKYMAEEVEYDKTQRGRWTYVFEYCSPKNKIVTPYSVGQMVLVTLIKNCDGEEIERHHMVNSVRNGWGAGKFRLIDGRKFATIDDLLVALEALPDLQEGFVAQDPNGLRVKFKNSLYLKLHKMRGDGFTQKKICSIVGAGEEDEVLAYFKEEGGLFAPYVLARDYMFAHIKNTYLAHAGIADQKEFALTVQQYAFKGMLFAMRKRGITFEQAWEDMRDEYRVEMLIEYHDKLMAMLGVTSSNEELIIGEE